jgi:hypothetical protein
MKHEVTIVQVGEGAARAVCSCGWQSPLFGEGKKVGTMDVLQRATDAGDVHEWDASFE